VNHKVNVSKDYYRKLRMTIHLCKTRGIESVAGNIPVEKFKRSLIGRINHVVEVNPERGKKLLEEFNEI
jgi:hypothetical protein